MTGWPTGGGGSTAAPSRSGSTATLTGSSTGGVRSGGGGRSGRGPPHRNPGPTRLHPGACDITLTSEGDIMSRGGPSGCVLGPFVLLYLMLYVAWCLLQFVILVPAAPVVLLRAAVRRLVRGPDLQYDAAGVR